MIHGQSQVRQSQVKPRVESHVTSSFKNHEALISVQVIAVCHLLMLVINAVSNVHQMGTVQEELAAMDPSHHVVEVPSHQRLPLLLHHLVLDIVECHLPMQVQHVVNSVRQVEIARLALIVMDQSHHAVVVQIRLPLRSYLPLSVDIVE